jgi:Cell differentiation family, Rcd1-like
MRVCIAHIPLFLYPFLNTTSKSRPFEYLRLTSLGVIGALVKSDSPPTIEFLLTTEIIPLCLRIMETGSELSKVPPSLPLVTVDIYANICRLLRFSFYKRFFWMIKDYNIFVEHMIGFWQLHKFSMSWSTY